MPFGACESERSTGALVSMRCVGLLTSAFNLPATSLNCPAFNVNDISPSMPALGFISSSYSFDESLFKDSTLPFVVVKALARLKLS